MEIKITMEELQKAVTKMLAENLSKRGPAMSASSLSNVGYLGTSVRCSMNETSLYIETAFVKELNIVGNNLNPAMNLLSRNVVSDDVRDHMFVTDRRVPNYKINHPQERVFECEIKKSHKNKDVLILQYEPFQLLSYLMDFDLSEVDPKDVKIIAHSDASVPASKILYSERKLENQKVVDYVKLIVPHDIKHGFTYDGFAKFMKNRRNAIKGKVRKGDMKETGRTFVQPDTPRRFGI